MSELYYWCVDASLKIHIPNSFFQFLALPFALNHETVASIDQSETPWFGEVESQVFTKYPRFLILSWEKEYLQTKQLLNATSHFLISHIVGHL